MNSVESARKSLLKWLKIKTLVFSWKGLIKGEVEDKNVKLWNS